MKKNNHILLAATMLLFVSGAQANYPTRPDSLSPGNEKKSKRERSPMFFSLKASGGQVFQTNDFVRGDNKIPFYGSGTVKFGINSVGNRWEDIVYGMPYYGIGVYMADFGRERDLGNPISVYMLQGASLSRLSSGISLNYEWNIGASMGWQSYDAFDNPENVAIGSDVNVHVGANIYFKWRVAQWLDINLGADVTHFSNGAQKMPNAGMNMYSVYVETVFNLNRARVVRKFDPHLVAPPYEKHFVSDISMNISSREISVDTVGTGLPSPYLDHKFQVLGLNYALMYAPGYRYRYGLGVDFVYDESSGSYARREMNPRDGKFYDRVYYGKMHERLSLGISAKGEVVLPGYSIFANMGIQLHKGNKREGRFYQIIGVKVYLKENFFGTFGIRANHFSKAQSLFWSLGYSFDHFRKKR